MKRVLVAEQEPEVDRQPGEGESGVYRFTFALGFAEAVKLIADRDAGFDFLVTDIVLKPFQGRDLANRMVGAQPGIKVLFMGKHPARLLRGAGLLPPFAPFLHKPFARRHLIEVLDEFGSKGPAWLDLILSQGGETAPSS